MTDASILDQLQLIMQSVSSSSLLPSSVHHPCPAAAPDQNNQQLQRIPLEPCILCGRIMVPGVDRRYKDLNMLADLFTRRCHPTPYVFSCIMAEQRQLKESSITRRVCCCIACINWVRRLSNTRGITRAKIPIPMDNLILFLQCPGAAVVKPDQRSLHRMMGSLANQVAVATCCKKTCSARIVDNIYSRFCTPVMDRSIALFRQKYMKPLCQDGLASICQKNSICCMVELYTTAPQRGADADLVDSLVRTWWESIGMPAVLTDRVTAR